MKTQAKIGLIQLIENQSGGVWRGAGAPWAARARPTPPRASRPAPAPRDPRGGAARAKPVPLCPTPIIILAEPSILALGWGRA